MRTTQKTRRQRQAKADGEAEATLVIQRTEVVAGMEDESQIVADAAEPARAKSSVARLGEAAGDPASTTPTTNDQIAQAAQFRLENRADSDTDEIADESQIPLDDLMKTAVENQRLALEADRFVTILYCRAGLSFLALKSALVQRGRRDFCRHTESAGIKPWFRSRAMQIAMHFASEEACQGITLLEALTLARKRPKPVIDAAADANVTKKDNVDDSVTDVDAANRIDKNISNVAAVNRAKQQPAAKRRATKRAINATQIHQWRSKFPTDYQDITGCEIDVGIQFLQFVGGKLDRAIHIIAVLHDAIVEEVVA